MVRNLIFWILLILYLHFTLSARPEILCRDPDVGGTKQNHERKFLVLGAENSGGAGVGNLLIFFPAAFYFAALTGRDIAITDGSVLGGICSIIYCGFPFVSQISLAFPKIMNPATLAAAETLKFQDFIRYIEGGKDANSQPVVKAGGFLSKSDWWVWFQHTVACVSRLTGCEPGDVMCAERHAYQRLIRGPFKAGFTEKEEARIRGVPDSLKHALLTLPHSYAPRLDLAIHFRVQFHHFEQSQATSSSTAHQLEVQHWLNSSECQQVFSSMLERANLQIQQINQRQLGGSSGGSSSSSSNQAGIKVINKVATTTATAAATVASSSNSNSSSLKSASQHSQNSTTNVSTRQQQRQLNALSVQSAASGTSAATLAAAASAANPIYIYIAADNEEVKDRFSDLLRAHLAEQAATKMITILIMQIDATSIVHVKDYAKFQKLTNNEGLLDLVFDWYALSLANHLLAWRKGGTNLLSTFVHSAQKVSGTVERTDNSQGKGIGTRGYQLIRDKRGGLRFELFWGYDFVDDYKQKRR